MSRQALLDARLAARSESHAHVGAEALSSGADVNGLFWAGLALGGVSAVYAIFSGPTTPEGSTASALSILGIGTAVVAKTKGA
jgi:Na+/H+-translocating membrane pyrophosphatase